MTVPSTVHMIEPSFRGFTLGLAWRVETVHCQATHTSDTSQDKQAAAVACLHDNQRPDHRCDHPGQRYVFIGGEWRDDTRSLLRVAAKQRSAPGEANQAAYAHLGDGLGIRRRHVVVLVIAA